MFLGRVVADGEALWTSDDAAAILELLREKSMLCPGCGLPRDETMSPEAERLYTSRAFRCHACKARESASEKFRQSPHDAGGLYFTIEKQGG